MDFLKLTMARKKGACRICKKRRELDPHHIISQHHAKKTKQPDLITNPGNIVYICRKCHNQTTASKSRYRIMRKGKEAEVDAIEIEKVRRMILRMRKEHREDVRNIRELANKEIQNKNTLKDVEISILELENSILTEEKETLQNDIDILNSLSFEHHISNEVQKISKNLYKILNPAKKKVVKTKKIVEKRVEKGIRTVRNTVKDTRRDIRERTGI
tara:strand:- start:96 stop:740 length:645 start_codon:yes stop_codon:yes gene_type:complete